MIYDYADAHFLRNCQRKDTSNTWIQNEIRALTFKYSLHCNCTSTKIIDSENDIHNDTIGWKWRNADTIKSKSMFFLFFFIFFIYSEQKIANQKRLCTSRNPSDNQHLLFKVKFYKITRKLMKMLKILKHGLKLRLNGKSIF